jgi:hypothetical protein
MSNLHVYIAIEGFLPQIVVFNDVVWKKLEGHLHVLVLIKRHFKTHVLISAPLNLTPGVLMTLFHMIFAETMLAVRVVSLYG